VVERTWTVLNRGTRYQIRDLDGQPISRLEAKKMIKQVCTVPDQVRAKARAHSAATNRAKRPAERRRSHPADPPIAANPVGAEESSTWSARPTDIADERRRTNDIDLDERRPIIVQPRNGPAAMPTTMNL
jgi:hypothetical protein